MILPRLAEKAKYYRKLQAMRREITQGKLMIHRPWAIYHRLSIVDIFCFQLTVRGLSFILLRRCQNSSV
jgi:hypothetical protein